MIQGSEEWFAARVGKVTASRIADIMATTKSGPAASRKNYLAELIAERMTGTTANSFKNAAMQWGIDTEPEARMAYEFIRDVEVAQIGFVDHPEIPMSGASPDGLIGEDGLAEIKCPNTATHIDTLLGASIPSKYTLQMQWQMACTGRAWCDFVSYDPRLPEAMRLHIRRVLRDEDCIAGIVKEVTAFMTELNVKVESLRRLYGLESNETVEKLS